MFCWSTATLRAGLAAHAPKHSEALVAMDKVALDRPDHADALRPIFAALPNLSIDFAVMDHARNLWALPVSYPWVDVGSWESVREVLLLDELQNARRGETIAVDTKGSTLYSTGPLIATCGVEDLVIVATDDAVLVCPRARVAEIRSVVAALRDEKRESHL
jgi:mannose-1-phosphate guanylyltransferase